MKQVKKIFAFVVAFVMALGIALPAVAEEATGQSVGNGPASITITLPIDPAPNGTTTYSIYKVFDATATTDGKIAYSLPKGTTFSAPMSTFFDIDDAGNVTAKPVVENEEVQYWEHEDGTKAVKLVAEASEGELSGDAIAAIGGFVANATPITARVPEGNATWTVSGLDYGYYYISTSTGTVVSVNSTTPDAQVNDKNILTTVDKKHENNTYAAIGQTGAPETFNGYITLGKGATEVKYHDKMTNMTFNADSLVVTVTTDEGTTEIKAGATTYTATPKQGNFGFDVEFKDAFIANYSEGDLITLTYTGTITTDAWNSPAINEATVTFGNNGANEQKPGTPEVKVYVAQVGVNKTFVGGSGSESAGFVLKKKVTENGAEVVKYYKYANGVVSWVDSIDDADEHTTGENNVVDPFVGLDNGTYYLEEKTVPAGYNQALDTEVVIADGNYEATNLNQTGQNGKPIENRQGTTMPSTGGIGTTIFYVVGGVMVAGAVIFLLTKRRAASNVE